MMLILSVSARVDGGSGLLFYPVKQAVF